MNIELFERLKKECDKIVTVNINGVETKVMIRSPRDIHGWMAFWNECNSGYRLEITPDGKCKLGRKKEYTYPCENGKRFNKFINVIGAVNNAMK